MKKNSKQLKQTNGSRQLTAAEVKAAMPKNMEGLTKAERVLRVIAKNEGKTRAEIAKAGFIDHNQIFFQDLVDKGLLRMQGKGRGATYFRGRNYGKQLPAATRTRATRTAPVRTAVRAPRATTVRAQKPATAKVGAAKPKKVTGIRVGRELAAAAHKAEAKKSPKVPVGSIEPATSTTPVAVTEQSAEPKTV